MGNARPCSAAEAEEGGIRMESGALKGRRFLSTAALALFLCMAAALALCSLVLYAFLGLNGPYEEWVTFMPERLLPNLAMTAAALLALSGMNALLRRFARIHLSGVMLGLWLAAALFWIVGIGLIQERDCEAVMNAARQFAVDDYHLMRWGYFKGCSFQLGFVLMMESVLRLFPAADINMVVQVANVIFGVMTAGVMAALCEILFKSSAAKHATLLIYVLYLPFLLFNVYVYGTVMMIFFCACAFLCFALYLRRRKLRFAAAMMLSLAVGYIAKQNALIPMIALTICAALDAMTSRDGRALLCAAGSIVLGMALARLIVWQYELRSGIALEENVSLLTWLMMGLGEPASMPGWYNGYVGEFFDLYLPAEEQSAIVMADLKARIPELLADPAYTAAFLRDKVLSQWMEPTCSVMWWGFRCEWTGHFNGLAALLYREGQPLRAAADAYMNVYQQCVYLLACIGGVSALRRRDDAAVLVLPVTLLGGLLFHALFEAKSQYIYPYMIYMMPLAAQGLCVLGDGVRRGISALRGRRARG